MLPIEVEDLTKVYDGRAVVDRVTFSVARHHVFGLLGPNGAGKTTTIKLLAGLIRPQAGRIRILGIDLTRQPLAVKSVIGHVYANMAFYNDMSALDNLTFFGRLHRIRGKRLRQRVGAMLRFVGLWDERGKRVGKYSQGMKQRLGIARALLHEPSVLLLDEPTSGIDVQGVNSIRELIYQLRSQDKTILIASHQLGEIELISDSIGLLKNGRLVSIGTSQGIKESLRGILYKYVVRVPQPIKDFGLAAVECRHVKDSNIVLASEPIESDLAERFGADLVEPLEPTLEEAFLWMLGNGK